MVPAYRGPVTVPGVGIVTGGGRGIGRAVALALARAGHAVGVNDTGVALDGGDPGPGPAESVAEEIRAAGGRALAVATDARTRAGAEALVAAVAAWGGGPPAVLVHAAGTLRDAMVHKASDEDWSEVLGSHLAVAVELTRALSGPIRRGGYGRIVYLGGAAGLVGSAGQAAYAVAKAGLFGLTRAVALEMAGRDVCVNYVAPFAFTRMTESIPPATEQLRRYLETAPAAGPDDVAPLVAWLCSPSAAGVSGQIFGARGAEIALWSQPRPVVRLVESAGWDAGSLTAARARMDADLVPLESEFDLFGGPPAAVRR
jgi:NAD(P)-dependent dehydrogenase (short-subunit alcohol dehydrogenase family)